MGTGSAGRPRSPRPVPPARARHRPNGYVRLYNQYYHHAELNHWHEKEVQVAYDLHDGDQVWVKTLDGQLICEAKWYQGRSYRPQSFYEQAEIKRAAARVKRLNAKVDAAQATVTGADLDAQKDGQAIAANAKILRDNLVIESPTLPVDPDAESLQTTMVSVEADFALQSVVKSSEPNGPKAVAALDRYDRYRYWQQLQTRPDLADWQRRFFTEYPSHEEHRTLTQMIKDFGESAVMGKPKEQSHEET